ncbi:unnamed protein product [Calypogeia fissa]
MKGRPLKIRRLNETNEDSTKFFAAQRRATGGSVEKYQLQQNDEGFKDASSALPEFLVPGREMQQPSRFPSYALLSGPPKCGKTSLLLQLACNLAVDARARVVFICKRQNFENDYIYLSRDLETASEVCERVHIKYVKCGDELRKYFAAFHLQRELPTAVIVDDFVEFFADSYERQRFQLQTTGEVSLVKALSLCRSAIEYANAKAMSGMQCRLIISDTHPRDGPRLLYIFKRWMPLMYVIKGLRDSSRFSLELQDIRTGGMSNVIGKFTLAHQALHFDGLEA